jgi:signal transduction histidine kinase
MRGIRSRLALALVAIVVVTVTTIGIGTYLFVEARLRDGLLTDAERQAQFNLSVLIPERLPDGVMREDLEGGELADALRLRGDIGTIVDFQDGATPYVEPASLLGAIDGFPAAARSLAESGHLGFAWLEVGGRPSLVVGGRQGAGPIFYFVFPADSIEAALEQLRLGLLAAALIAVALALAAAGFIARGILRPVDSGSAAAARIAAGDLSARLPAGGADEFARFAAEFNRMADSLAATVTRLEASERQNRRFVSDVSHELRTPLTALVAEASIIEAGLDGLPPDGRRAGELLVADVRRLRVLVDDLMELSRFDAKAEQADLEPVNLGDAVQAIVAARLPTAVLQVPDDAIVVAADVRRLDRIVGNLLDNARQHAPDALVEVIVGAAGGWASVTVADRGPGVAPDAIAQLFDRFYKADASRHVGSSGLGLAIAAEHAALLGGDVLAANRQNGGLEVMLRLPVTGSLPRRDLRDTSVPDAGNGSDAALAPTEPTRPNP